MSKPFLALLAASIIWGAASPIFRWALFNIPIFSLAFLRFGIATILLFPLVRKELATLQLTRNNLVTIVAAGLLGVALNIPLFFFGLKLSTAINAGLLIGATPLFSVVAGVLLLKERSQPRIWAGAALGFVGILVLLLEPLLRNGFDLAFLGNILLLLAVLSWVGYEIVSKKLFQEGKSAQLVTFFSFWLGALVFLPFAGWELLQNPNWVFELDIRGYTGIIFGALLSSFAAYLLWQWGLSKTQVQKAGIFLYIEPVVAAAIAIPLLGESFTPLLLLSAAFIFAGLWLAEKQRG